VPARQRLSGNMRAGPQAELIVEAKNRPTIFRPRRFVERKQRFSHLAADRFARRLRWGGGQRTEAEQRYADHWCRSVQLLRVLRTDALCLPVSIDEAAGRLLPNFDGYVTLEGIIKMELGGAPGLR
jgi:hypothetical protein